jgi:uncharacterized protein
MIKTRSNKSPFHSKIKNAVKTDWKIICRIILLSLFCSLLLQSCGRSYTTAEKEYITGIEKERLRKNEEMRNDPDSPFNRKGKIEFYNLKYFDPDPDFVFRSRLTPYNPQDTITVYGTKGEPRKAVRYGYLIWNYKNQKIKVNVYKGTAKDGQDYYAIWFTDYTTNKESYGVGRYIDFELSEDKNKIYDVDFNKAYNPYCAYSPDYSCAVPTKEDFIPVEIKAGEKKFHN